MKDPSSRALPALGLMDGRTEFRMGLRSKRFSMIVDDGVVQRVNVEDIPAW